MLHFADLKQHPESVATIAELGYRGWGEPDPSAAVEFLQCCLSAQTLPCTQLALFEGRLAGSISLLEHEMGDVQPAERRHWLGYLVVDPALRGQGIGRQLIAHMQQVAREMGIEQVYCYTIDQAELYQFLGWMPLESLDYQGHRVTVMTRQLDP